MNTMRSSWLKAGGRNTYNDKRLLYGWGIMCMSINISLWVAVSIEDHPYIYIL